MSERRPEPDPEERDERAAEPPSGDDTRSEEDDPPGPRGNPESDEEALRHRQQEND
ncbi:MAG: hypothetical protein ACJ75R_03225 [Solirubrobacterales bacterium]